MRLILFANTDWYLYNFRRSLALSLRDAGYEVLLLSPPGPFGQKLRDLGLHWRSVPMVRRSLNPLREALLIWVLWRLFRRERPTLVHGFTIKCAVYGSIAARLALVPARISAVTGMGYVFTSGELKARLLRPLVCVLLRLSFGGRGSRLILQNSDDVNLFTGARLVDPALVRLIPGSGVDCSRFCATRGSRTSGPIQVLLASRLLWDKGLAEYVAAARQLRGEGRTFRFLLAGDSDSGNPRAVSETTIAGWEAEGIVELLGHVDDMPRLYSQVDIVVLPSYREGLPKGLIEAAACGLPLVATDVPGCRDVVADGIDGLLVPPRDATALAHAIAFLADSPLVAARLGAAARSNAVGRFDERIVIARTLAIYGELVSNSTIRTT